MALLLRKRQACFNIFKKIYSINLTCAHRLPWDLIPSSQKSLPHSKITVFKGLHLRSFANLLSLRAMPDASLQFICRTFTYPSDVRETTHPVTSLDGSDISVTRFLATSVQAAAAVTTGVPQRAATFAFGDGVISGSVEIYRNVVAPMTHKAQASKPDAVLRGRVPHCARASSVPGRGRGYFLDRRVAPGSRWGIPYLTWTRAHSDMEWEADASGT